MSSITQKLMEQHLFDAPPFLKTNVMYETIMGSHAYGVADTSIHDKVPDFDIYGFAIPPKDLIFPHLTGHIDGFGDAPARFEQFQKHHVFEPDGRGGVGKEWDVSIFGIVKYFELCRQNNPNMIDSLFTPESCVIHCTEVGRMVRDSRRLFLSKLAWKTFRGYAQGQLKKMQDKNPVGNRLEIVEKFGFDVKFAYHIIRLFDEAEQILVHGDIDLQRAREAMKAIRRGEWSVEEVCNWAIEKEKALEIAYINCRLPDRPNSESLRRLLLSCLEQHYGSLDKCVSSIEWAEVALRGIDNLLNGVRSSYCRKLCLSEG